ncbi:hypothetical protein HELRODRAFT_182369 [Helobdella robusta]|uniref:Uncharacterized protein n=1 Tax=Helobdella robusta TaxID=6412 RepID=T1FI42_HELRO|nr:hypothetical protein HELRODRAFT_182369 [Helobdella robusta]ESN91022.1 hypothetical protein HELRODRAFT_182369 [Helobdella robusta]
MVAGQVLNSVENSGEGIYNAMSMSNLAANFLKMWWSGSGNEGIYSVCIMSQNWYDVDYGIFFHFPVSFDKPGEYTVITDLSLTWDVQYNIRRIITAYIQHMVEALFKRATKVNTYIAALNTDKKNDATCEYPVAEFASDTIVDKYGTLDSRYGSILK